MENVVKKTLMLFGLLVTVASSSVLHGQQAGYSQTNLVSNTAGVANTTDPQLLNPWGISALAGQDFWIANNNGGTSTLYDPQGSKNALVVTIPGATKNPNGNCSPGCPTGTVSNSTGGYFSGGTFIFDTEDGLIVNWTGGSSAVVAFDNSASGAVYKGLALLNGTFLLAANFNSGKIDVYDRNFNPASLSGSFTNPNLPAGYAPHNIHVIGNQIYVAYAMQDVAKHDSQPGAGKGQVDIFDLNGNFVSTFVPAGGQLNAPWGVAEAPTGFGSFPNAILVGNFGDGTINAYDTTGKFLGQLTDASNHPLVNPGLWEITFGGGGLSGDPGTLYLTAGGGNQPNFPAGGSTTAVFASVVPATAVPNADFSLNLSAQSATVAPNGSTSLKINASAVGGFNGQIELSCAATPGLTCAFNPTTISPGSSAASSTLTVSAAATPPGGGGYGVIGTVVLLPGLGAFGTVLANWKRKRLTRRGIMLSSILGMILVSSLFAVGCSSSSKGQMASPQQVTLMVTGKSGTLSHTAPVTITVQ
jgi:uncharacterized protein (TIGR03118 family)